MLNNIIITLLKLFLPRQKAIAVHFPLNTGMDSRGLLVTEASGMPDARQMKRLQGILPNVTWTWLVLDTPAAKQTAFSLENASAFQQIEVPIDCSGLRMIRSQHLAPLFSKSWDLFLDITQNSPPVSMYLGLRIRAGLRICLLPRKDADNYNIQFRPDPETKDHTPIDALTSLLERLYQ